MEFVKETLKTSDLVDVLRCQRSRGEHVEQVVNVLDDDLEDATETFGVGGEIPFLYGLKIRKEVSGLPADKVKKGPRGFIHWLSQKERRGSLSLQEGDC